MPLIPEKKAILRGFLKHSDFSKGAVILDLDGTALHESEGKVFISGSVERGVKAVAALGRPVIVNTLRFPLSIIRKVAPEWLDYTEKIEAIMLNGSLIGRFERVNEDTEETVFIEESAYPIEKAKIAEIISGVGQLLEHRIFDMDLFYYPRDWKKGEQIWVPLASRIEKTRAKYKSASVVHDGLLTELQERLYAEDICMMMLLIDRPRDELMAYQHQEPSDFFTQKGVNKSSTLREYARRKNIALLDSIAGGDTLMDNFLADAGLALIVGEGNRCPYRGRKETLWLRDPAELGNFLCSLSKIVRGEDV